MGDESDQSLLSEGEIYCFAGQTCGVREQVKEEEKRTPGIYLESPKLLGVNSVKQNHKYKLWLQRTFNHMPAYYTSIVL